MLQRKVTSTRSMNKVRLSNVMILDRRCIMNTTEKVIRHKNHRRQENFLYKDILNDLIIFCFAFQTCQQRHYCQEACQATLMLQRPRLQLSRMAHPRQCPQPQGPHR